MRVSLGGPCRIDPGSERSSSPPASSTNLSSRPRSANSSAGADGSATLIKMGMVEEGHLIRALAKQLDLPVASLAGKRIPEDVLALVPARVEHGVIPLFIKEGGRNNQLFLGMEDPLNLAILDDLSFRTGMEIHPVMVGPSGSVRRSVAATTPARRGPAARSARGGGAMNPASLRVVTDDSAQQDRAGRAVDRIGDQAAARPAASVVTPPIELDDPVAAPGAPQARVPGDPGRPRGGREADRRGARRFACGLRPHGG